MKIVKFVPNNQPAEAWDIPDTLEAMQQTVGGHIEVVRLGAGYVIVCDEEGRLKGRPVCRWIPGLVHPIVGTFFIAKIVEDDDGEQDIGGLTMAEVRRILDIDRLDHTAFAHYLL